jgi:hypothetical protein
VYVYLHSFFFFYFLFLFLQAESVIESLDIWREEKLKFAEHEATQKALGKEVIQLILFLDKNEFLI